MIEQISIERTSDVQVSVPLIDVRTPAEFAHGHIPGAFNIPLFSNEERVEVGTAYKQQGKDAAVLLGFDITGSKWSGFIKQALEIAPGKKLAVHCWRGGMRSGAMAWALNFYGFKVSVIRGGYKAYRNAVHQSFSQPFNLNVLGGTTGSGKTEVLKKLSAKGEQVIDLEELAAHQGSAYGSLNKMKQPTQEQFENNLGEVISKLDVSKPVWVEDESINIGSCQVPKPFWSQFAGSQLINLEVDREKRVSYLSEVYGNLDKEFLIDRTLRIKKRLGPEQTKFAITAINENRMNDFIRQVLVYYDKTYNASLSKRNPIDIISIQSDTSDASEQASAILKIVKEKIKEH